MRTLIYSIVLIAFSVSTLSAQFVAAPIFTGKENINLEQAADGKFYYMHEVKKGQTLYALSVTFGQSLASLQSLNNKSTVDVALGEIIKIPIAQNFLFKGDKAAQLEGSIYVPVVYKVKPKDNLYRISKVYFNQPMEMIQNRNNLATTAISVDSDIILGWYPIDTQRKFEWKPKPSKSKTKTTKTTTTTKYLDGKTTTTQKVTHKPTHTKSSTGATIARKTDFTVTQVNSESENDAKASTLTNETAERELDATTEEDFNHPLLGKTLLTEDMNLTKEKEVANWDRNVPDNGEIYVLHNNAVVDTYVEMKNELTGRIVKAKVIGKIPFGAYTSDVQLIISPSAAQALGALDERLRVSLEYYRG